MKHRTFHIRWLVIIAILSALSLTLNPQDALREVVIRIELPVRVFSAEGFIPDLSMSDFRVIDGGEPQQITSFYFVNNNRVVRREGDPEVRPSLSRSFYLFCEISEYTEELHDIFETFIHKMLLPEDNLILITPSRTFQIKSEALDTIPRKELLKQLGQILEDNALSNSLTYAELFADLGGIVTEVEERVRGRLRPNSSGPTLESKYENISTNSLITRYLSSLERLIKLRKINAARLEEYSELLGYQEGQKYAFFFYQRDAIPELNEEILNEYTGVKMGREDISQNLDYISDFFSKDIAFDPERLAQTLSHGAILTHFLLFDIPTDETTRSLDNPLRMNPVMKCNMISDFTGGFVFLPYNSMAMFENILESLGSYYLVYYSPTRYSSDGRFKNITIEIRGKNNKVRFRKGYYSD